MEKIIDYEELYDELEGCCHKVLDRCVNQIEKNGTHNPIETIIHNISMTERYISPPEKKLVKDFKTIQKELGKERINKLLMGDGVVANLASVVWYKRKLLRSLQCKSDEVNYKNYIELVAMIYEAGRQRYLGEDERSELKEIATIMWEYFHSEREKKDEGLLPENAVRLAKAAEKLDEINSRYEEKELNDATIVYNSYPTITEYVLQKCFEGFCSQKYSIKQLIEKFLNEEIDDIDHEIRRFSEYYKRYFKKYWKKEMSGVVDVKKNSCIPVTRIANVELLYFASLDDKLFGAKSLGEGRKIFAKKYIRDVFGEDLKIISCIEQARILLALCGFYKISSELLDSADYQMLQKLVEYLSKPVLFNEKEIHVSNPITEHWIFTCHIANKLYEMSEGGKKLSKSRKDYVLEYARKLKSMQPFQIRLQYFQDNEKFIASSGEDPFIENPTYPVEDSWFGQQRKILSTCVNETTEQFVKRCNKFSEDTDIKQDDIILEMVHGNFRSKCKNDISHLQIEKNIKLAISFMYKIYNKN